MPHKNYSFSVKDDILYLVYTTEYDISWIFDKLKVGSTTLLGKVFTITEGKKLGDSEDNEKKAEFSIGLRENQYFKIDPLVLGTKYPVLLHEDAITQLEPKDFFVCQPYFDRKPGNKSRRGMSSEKYIPLLPKLEEMFDQSIKIGGDDENSIPFDAFSKAISIFPDREEVKRYMNSRISHILGEYIVPKRDFSADRDRLIEFRERKFSQSHTDSRLSYVNKIYKTEVFKVAQDELTNMLDSVDVYKENAWQDKIMDIVLLLYPKYIHMERSLRVQKDKSYGIIDIALFDTSGFIDIVEIKKPEVNGAGVLRKTMYRKNYIPSRELSGAIMQVEKYSFWLSRWGKKGEKVLQNKYKSRLPNSLKIKIANPVGIIIFGRDLDFSDEEKQDFEIIKRKYKHIVDILTYDDLQRRLSNILTMLKNDNNII